MPVSPVQAEHTTPPVKKEETKAVEDKKPTEEAPAAGKEEGKHHFHFLPGRRRGQSGTGNELGDIPRPQSRGHAEVTVR